MTHRCQDRFHTGAGVSATRKGLDVDARDPRESVESGVTSLESEFLADVMLPNGRTVGQVLTPQIEEAYATGRFRGMLAEGSQ